jgi:hypothetical protein
VAARFGFAEQVPVIGRGELVLDQNGGRYP